MRWTKKIEHTCRNTPSFAMKHAKTTRQIGWPSSPESTFFTQMCANFQFFLCDRHDSYVVFMRAVMSIISRVHVAAQEFRSAQERIGHHPERPLPGSIVFNPPWEPATRDYKHFAFKCSQSMLSQHIAKQPFIIASFTKLLTCSTFCMASQSSGITWLEPFFLSVAAAENPWALLHSTTAQAQPTIARQLREFATAATATLKFMLSDADQRQFLASNKQPNRLAAFGYQNRPMHTSTHIAISKATQAALHEAMLSFRQPLSPDQRVALANGSVSIKTTKYAGHHTFKGGRTIIRFAESFRRELGTVQAIFAQVPDQPCSFCCPNNHLRSSDSQFDCFNIAKSMVHALQRLPRLIFMDVPMRFSMALMFHTFCMP